jgi:hypothetical protein
MCFFPRIRYRAGNFAVGLDFGKITHTFQQTIGNSRRSPGPVAHLPGAALINGDSKKIGGAFDDYDKFFRAIKIKTQNDPRSGRAKAGLKDQSG